MILSNTYASFINLDHRPDRLHRMQAELERIGIEATRTRGFLPEEYAGNPEKVKVMLNRTPGAIGCHYSQVAVMQDALEVRKHAFVMEDDLVFCSDIQERLKHITEFTDNNEWDIIWLGGTYHLQPTWHKVKHGKHVHPDLQMCDCQLNKDWEPTHDPRFVRTYGIWSTYAYIVNVNSIEKILKLLDKNVHLSMGIDWLFILLQPRLKTFAYHYGCVKQYDNQSDIGNGITRFSGFEKACGKHWFKDRV
jgi:GR25 family glycosyltransferase involved in LPS biosynthesis